MNLKLNPTAIQAYRIRILPYIFRNCINLSIFFRLNNYLNKTVLLYSKKWLFISHSTKLSKTKIYIFYKRTHSAVKIHFLGQVVTANLKEEKNAILLSCSCAKNRRSLTKMRLSLKKWYRSNTCCIIYF